jgi:tRNA nucleotidyltransferase (CCA-adding enzyme)
VTLRWAALLHDVGKIPCFTLDEQGIGHFHGHADVSAQMADEILLRLKAPTQLRQDVVFLIEKHMNPAQPDRKLLRRWISRFGAERTRMLLQLQRADVQATIPGREENFPEIFSLFEEILAENACLSLKDLAINGNDLMALGFRGPSIGACLNQLLTLVVQEQLPNHRQTLLDFALREFHL